MARTKQCLTNGCDRDGLHRGLCSACYQAARRAIKAGADEDQMIASGLILSSNAGNKSLWLLAAQKAGVVG